MPRKRTADADAHSAELDELQKQIDEFKELDEKEGRTAVPNNTSSTKHQGRSSASRNYVDRVRRKSRHMGYAGKAGSAAMYITPECFVHTGRIMLSDKHVATCGLSTCSFVAIRLQRSFIGWHCSSDNMKGAHMDGINSALLSLDLSGLCDVFLVPGADRNVSDPASPNYMHLKSASRQMREYPETDPAASWDWLKNVLQTHNLFDRLEIVPPPSSYKDFIVLDSEHPKPFVISDPTVFDSICKYNAETDAANCREVCQAAHRAHLML